MSALRRYQGDRIIGQIRRSRAIAIAQALEHVRGVAVNRTPRDRGDLRASASVSTVAEIQQEGRGALSYDTPYAVAQHEHTEWHHEVGQAKYLESAINDTRAQVQQIIARRLGEVTR